MIEEKKAINPMQIRVPDSSREHIKKEGKRKMRTMSNEAAFRLLFLEELEKKGEIIVP